MIDRIKTSKAPEALGTYSQGSKVDNLVFTSGQIGIDPATGILITDNFKEEVLQVLNNVSAILDAGGSSIDELIKLTVFIKDISNFKAVNDIFSSFFSTDYPARSLVEISDLPAGANIEIEAIGKIL
jgi:2-iminobutanoate/2-iminopropanoate deaminase